MPEIRAAAVDGVRSQPTSNGQMGLLHFQRVHPDANGSRELNVAVPAALLPYVAVAALEAVPQPGRGPSATHPVVLPAKSVQVGLATDGPIVLTIELDMGARISFSIEQKQAEGLQQELSIALGRRRAQAFRASARASKPASG